MKMKHAVYINTHTTRIVMNVGYEIWDMNSRNIKYAQMSTLKSKLAKEGLRN